MSRNSMNSVLGKAVLATLVCFTIALSGCGPKGIPGLVTVKGVVTYEGLPLPWASVSFAPDDGATGARVSTAMTDANGEFTLGTLGRKGCLPGNYVVSVEKYIADEEGAVEAWEAKRASGSYDEPRPSNGFAEEDATEHTQVVKPAFKVVSAIPLKFAEKETSGLNVTITEKGDKALKIELSKN